MVCMLDQWTGRQKGIIQATGNPCALSQYLRCSTPGLLNNNKKVPLQSADSQGM